VIKAANLESDDCEQKSQVLRNKLKSSLMKLIKHSFHVMLHLLIWCLMTKVLKNTEKNIDPLEKDEALF